MSGVALAGRPSRLTPTGRVREPLAWATYDFANTIYSFAVVSYAMGLWVTNPARLGPADGQVAFGIAAALSVLLNAIVSPVLGALSDRGGRRLPYLFAFTVLCIVPTALIGFSPVFVGLALFAIANFAYQAALIYYDATLPQVSTPAGRGTISGIGVAVGYLGTIFIGLILLVADIPVEGTFIVSAVLFAVFAAPIFLVVRERPTSIVDHARRDDAGPMAPRSALASWSQLRTTVRDAREVPGLPRFLLGRFFYSDPVNTVILVMSVFAVQAIGLTESGARNVLLILTVVAVIASLGWGRLVDRLGPKRTLMIVLGSWCVGLAIAGLVLTLPTFLLAGAILGSGLGGVQVADRVFMLRLSPPDKVGEFFGLYGLAGKLSAVTGPLMYGAIVGILLPRIGTVAYQIGILSLFVLMAIGIILVRPVSDQPRTGTVS